MKMARIVIPLLFAVLFSCNQTAQESVISEPLVEIDLETIRERGYINALVDNNSVSYFIYRGVPMGYEYELLSMLAKELNVDLKIRVISGFEQAVEQLNAGEGDLLAFPITINQERKEHFNFTKTQYNTYQVLVQRKPVGWRKLSADQINQNLVKNPEDLTGKEIHVIRNSPHARQLYNMEEELGLDLNIIEDSLTTESEAFIRKVATGEIEYTIADHLLAQVNAAYYDNLDVNTVMSLPRQVAWGVRKNSPELEKAINDWLTKIKKEPTFMIIYNRYYRSPRTSVIRLQSDFSSLGGKQLSRYDDLIRKAADQLGWDWRLLASLVYQESNFLPAGESWAGAKGLMQLMPETAKRFGANDLLDPAQSIKAGVGYLKYLNKYWVKKVPDEKERLNFILASYNAGLGHIIDAYRLAEKYDKNPTVWAGNVEEMLMKKSDPKYYRDPVVTSGYCKCEEPVNYVREIMERYEQYRLHIDF